VIYGVLFAVLALAGVDLGAFVDTEFADFL